MRQKWEPGTRDAEPKATHCVMKIACLGVLLEPLRRQAGGCGACIREHMRRKSLEPQNIVRTRMEIARGNGNAASRGSYKPKRQKNAPVGLPVFGVRFIGKRPGKGSGA